MPPTRGERQASGGSTGSGASAVGWLVATLTFFDVAIVARLGPYLTVPALFTIVTVAGLLAFSATEEKYSTAIRSAVLRERAARLLLIGLPFVYLSLNSGKYSQVLWRACLSAA